MLCLRDFRQSVVVCVVYEWDLLFNQNRFRICDDDLTESPFTLRTSANQNGALLIQGGIYKRETIWIPLKEKKFVFHIELSVMFVDDGSHLAG